MFSSSDTPHTIGDFLLKAPRPVPVPMPPPHVRRAPDPMPPTLPDLSPQIFAKRYEIITELGGGPNGITYRALDLKRDRPVSLRIISKSLFEDANAIAAFLALGLQYRKILNESSMFAYVYHVRETAGCVYVVSEFFEEPSLARQFAARRNGPFMFGIPDAVYRANTLCAAVEHALHAKFSPELELESIVLRENGDLRVLPEAVLHLRNDNARAAPSKTHRARTMHALGACLYTLLASERPATSPIALSKLRPEVSTRLNYLVTRLLSDARPLRVSAIKARLHRVVAELEGKGESQPPKSAPLVVGTTPPESRDRSRRMPSRAEMATTLMVAISATLGLAQSADTPLRETGSRSTDRGSMRQQTSRAQTLMGFGSLPEAAPRPVASWEFGDDFGRAVTVAWRTPSFEQRDAGQHFVDRDADVRRVLWAAAHDQREDTVVLAALAPEGPREFRIEPRIQPTVRPVSVPRTVVEFAAPPVHDINATIDQIRWVPLPEPSSDALPKQLTDVPLNWLEVSVVPQPPAEPTIKSIVRDVHIGRATFSEAVEADQRGLQIEFPLRVAGFSGEKIEIGAYFFTPADNRLRDSDGQFTSQRGYVYTKRTIWMGPDPMNAPTFRLFIPFVQLDGVTGGTRIMSAQVVAWGGRQFDQQVAEGARQKFQITLYKFASASADIQRAASTSRKQAKSTSRE